MRSSRIPRSAQRYCAMCCYDHVVRCCKLQFAVSFTCKFLGMQLKLESGTKSTFAFLTSRSGVGSLNDLQNFLPGRRRWEIGFRIAIFPRKVMEMIIATGSQNLGRWTCNSGFLSEGWQNCRGRLLELSCHCVVWRTPGQSSGRTPGRWQ